MVTAKQLRKLYYAEPFKPFVIVRNDGTRAKITDPIRFGIAEEEGKIMYADPRGGIAIARFNAVTIEVITRATTRHRRKAS